MANPTVAALFVDPKGVYASDPRCDCWPVARDARKYDGALPVVAHPPCQLWGAFAAINFQRWGGEHNLPGNDGGCFESALRSVFACGGVLEHPANSKAWDHFFLLRPEFGCWTRRWAEAPYWVTEVWQSAYGHKARKRTWLLYVGLVEPFPLRWQRIDGTHRIGHDKHQRSVKPRLEGRAASATPPDFSDVLIRLAEGCGL